MTVIDGRSHKRSWRVVAGVAHQLHAGPDTHGPAEPLRIVVETGDRDALGRGRRPHIGPQPFDRDIAPIVDE